MTGADRIAEIRRWHRLYRNPANQHWRDVDDLIDALDAAAGKMDFEGALADLEMAASDILAEVWLAKRALR